MPLLENENDPPRRLLPGHHPNTAMMSRMDTITHPPDPVKVRLATERLGILGVLRTARRNILEIIPAIATRQPMVSGRLVRRWHMVMDPDGLHRILREVPQNYPKSSIVKNILRPGIGDSLFIAEGRHWLWQRRAAAPVFAMRNIVNLAPIMAMAAQRAVARMRGNPDPIQNVHAEMVAATFEVISDVTFSGQGVFDRDAVHRAIDDYLEQTAQISILDIMGVPNWIPRPGRLRRTESNRQLKRIADAAIGSRLRTAEPAEGDLFHLLSIGEDPKTTRRMNRTELRDNLLTFIVAGHETTALTLSWALYLLAFDPDWQHRVRREIRTVIGDREASPETLDRLVLTRQVIQETLRLYPPAALLLRVALADDTIGGRAIRRGDSVMLPIYALHRSTCWWPDPDRFDPTRFAPDAERIRNTYLPFGEGPRICIGAGFAMQEAMIILTALLRRFSFALIPGSHPEPVMTLTLRPADGIWLDVQPLNT